MCSVLALSLYYVISNIAVLFIVYVLHNSTLAFRPKPQVVCVRQNLNDTTSDGLKCFKILCLHYLKNIEREDKITSTLDRREYGRTVAVSEHRRRSAQIGGRSQRPSGLCLGL